jgi:uncharacterized protein (TIGR02246 family)
MNQTDPLTTVRDILGQIQAAADARDLDSASALFADDAVLMGSAATSIGAEAIRDYLGLVFDQPGTIRWEWEDVRVVHNDRGVVTAVGTGQVGFSDDPERDPFRLTLLLVEKAQGWAIQHFHGSIPAG